MFHNICIQCPSTMFPKLSHVSGRCLLCVCCMRYMCCWVSSTDWLTVASKMHNICYKAEAGEEEATLSCPNVWLPGVHAVSRPKKLVRIWPVKHNCINPKLLKPARLGCCSGRTDHPMQWQSSCCSACLESSRNRRGTTNGYNYDFFF